MGGIVEEMVRGMRCEVWGKHMSEKAACGVLTY